jgi:hypothetical protein
MSAPRRNADPLEPVIRGPIDEWPQIKAPRVMEILRDDYG